MDPKDRGNAQLAAELIGEGIAAAKAGQTEHAREVLVRAVALDERNLQGWLWLSGVVEGLDDKEVCLENVLTLDPEHAAARQGLDYVRRQLQSARPATPSPIEEETSAQAVLIDNGTIPEEEIISPTLEPAVGEPDPPYISEPAAEGAMPAADPWDNELLCPYCATPTEPDDKRCPSCGQSLVLKVRRRESMSGWLRFIIILQGFNVVGSLIGAVLLVFLGIGMINMFAELPSSAFPVPTTTIEQTLTQASPLLMIAIFIPFIFSVIVLIGLMQRWRFLYYLMLIWSALSLLSTIAGIFMSGRSGLIPGIIGVGFGLLIFFVVFQMEDDFLYDERRIVMRIDPTAKNGMDFLTVGREYAQQRMWGLAAVHLRRAAGRMPEMIDTHLALGAALMNLKHYDEAARALGDARRVNPNHPGLQDLQNTLGELTERA